MPDIITSDTAIALMREELKKFRTKPDYYLKNETMIRCMFCGDSKKDERDMHLYIRVSVNEDEIAYFPFNCKLCGEKRRVFSLDDIKTFDITNKDLINYITNNYKNKGNRISTAKYNYIAKKLKSSIIECDIGEKRKYLYNRLQNEDVCNNPFKYKIILDLVSFFRENDLKPNFADYNDVKDLLRRLHEHYIGFLSFDNTHIIFRAINDKIGLRYIQYKIYPESGIGQGNDTSGFYTIPGNIEAMGTNLTLVMAEGTFDILRVYLDLFHKPAHNTVFAAVANANGYVPCIEKFLEYGIMFDTVHIYSDDDVSTDAYKNTLLPVIPGVKTVIHVNTLYKDFGDKQKPLNEAVKIIQRGEKDNAN
jgi:hypothetical protein